MVILLLLVYLIGFCLTYPTAYKNVPCQLSDRTMRHYLLWNHSLFRRESRAGDHRRVLWDASRYSGEHCLD